MRWSLSLLEYDFEIKHRAGTRHTNADALSRNVPSDTVHAVQKEKQPRILDTENNSDWTREKIRAEQRRDPTLEPIINYLEGKGETLIQTNSQFVLDTDGLLLHITAKKQAKRRQILQEQIVVPQAMTPHVMHTFHDTPFGGHFAFLKTYEKIFNKFYWRTMYKDIKGHVTSCLSCQGRNRSTKRRAPLQRFQPIAFEFVQVNLEKAAEGQERQVAKKATLTEFRIGDKVLLFSPAVKKGTTHKLNRPYKGPYRILERLSQINYKIGHIFNKRDIKIVHVDRIKEFIERTPFPAADLEAVISENDVPKKVLVPKSEKEISNHPTGQKKKPIDPWLLDEEHPVLTTPVLNNARINQPNKISLASPANSRNFVSTPQQNMQEQRYALRSTGTVPKLPWIFESTSTKEVTGTTENPASAVVTAPETHVDVSAGNASVDVPMSEVDTCSKEETELRENDTEMDLASSILAKMDYWLS
ncbi:Transposon Ty3-G Gag-Pol polyprotein [Nymphon striatum]|nr:Transposon Ty3-G Gag-Pol polyprotein [Nymphon striatum]